MAIVSDRAKNLGKGSEAQVMKVDYEIFEKNLFLLSVIRNSQYDIVLIG